MATTIPEPLLSAEPLAVTIYEWYCEALGNADKADDTDDADYYAGLVDAYVSVLTEMGALGDPTPPDLGTCAYCGVELRNVDGAWVDETFGDVCSGDDHNVNENQPHVLAIPELETEK